MKFGELVHCLDHKTYIHIYVKDKGMIGDWVSELLKDKDNHPISDILNYSIIKIKVLGSNELDVDLETNG